MTTRAPTPTATRPQRRTQAERSEAMRTRLIEATLKCLETDGYAGTTVTRIVETAEVSRGAPVHHFPSKAALIAAAAEHLMRRIYVQLGKAVSELDVSDDRLADIIFASWRQVFGATEFTILLELLVASRRDAELAAMLQHLWIAAFDTLGAAADHYLVGQTARDNVRHLMVLSQWLLRGMAADRHLVFNEQVLEHYLKLWCQLLAGHLRARPDVSAPPPRPEFWDMTFFPQAN